MFDILQSTLPIYLMILAGYAAVRSGYFPERQVGALSQFTLKICLPALIVFAVAFPHGEGGLDPAFFAAYAGGSLVTLVLGYAGMRLLLHQKAGESWIYGLGMANSNSGFLGFPLASLLFGPEGAVVFAMTMTVENTIMIPVATILASVAQNRGAKLGALVGAALGRMVRNPLLIAVVGALALRFSGVSPGAPVERAVTTLAMAASPVALFVIGGTVAGMSLSGHWRRSAAIGFGKLVVHPAVVALCLFAVPGVPPALIPVGILFAAVPMLTVYPIIAAPFGLAAVTSTALIATTLASVATVSVVLVLLQAL